MNFLPRLRQACREDHSEAATATREGQGSLGGHPSPAGAAGALQGQDPRLVLNRLFLSGVLVAEPQEDKDRAGDPVTLLLIAFSAPDSSSSADRPEVASCEVEVPMEVARKHGEQLHGGDSVFVTGQLSGGGGVVASELHSGPPPPEFEVFDGAVRP